MNIMQDGLAKADSVKKLALIVDDSSTARQLLKRLLESYGHDVLCAESAELAIQMLNQAEQGYPDVIFMDHNMPGMDGLQALKTIKANPRTAMIPILMYTSNGDSVYAEQAKRFGAVGIIPKELKHVALREVLDTLDKIITRSKQGDHELVGENTSTNASSIVAAMPHQAMRIDDALSVDAVPPLGQHRPSVKTRVRSSSDTDENIIGKSERSPEDVAKVSHSASIQTHGTAGNAGGYKSAEIYTKFFVDSVKQIQEQFQSIQSQLIETQREQRLSFSKLKNRLVLSACTLLAISLLLWFNPVTKWSGSQDDLAQNIVPQSIERKFLNKSVSISKKSIDASTIENKGTKNLQQQIWLLQSLINQGTQFRFDSPPFGDAQAKTVESLLKLLPTIGFSGTIQITAYFADFCVAENNGSWELANDSLPIEQCQFFIVDAMGYSELQSLGFSNLLNSNNLNSTINIAVNVQEDPSDYENKPDKGAVKTAGKWNQLIARNNRIEYQLLAENK